MENGQPESATRQRLNYDTIKRVADQLYEQQIEMPTAAKTHKLLGYGSLRDHQLYLNRWKQEKKQKPSSLRERHEKAVVEKAKAFAEALLTEHSKEIKAYKMEAAEQVKALEMALAEKESLLSLAQQAADQYSVQLEKAGQAQQALEQQIAESELVFDKIEKEHLTLQVKYEEAKASHQHQLSLLENHCNATEQRAKEHQAEALQLKAQNIALQEKLVQHQAEAQAQQHQAQLHLSQLQAKLEASENSKAQLKKELSELKYKNGELLAQNHNLQAEKEKLAQRLEEKTQLVLRGEFSKQALEAEFGRAQDQIKTQESKIEQLKSEKWQLGQENAKLQGNLTQIEKLFTKPAKYM
jgi:Chromosome segregation ATPases